MSIAFLGRVRAAPTLASISAFSAAWMAMLATRYYGLSADDINGGIGIGVDDGSWLSTAYSVCEPIGVIVGCWLAGGLSLRRVLLASVAIFLLSALLPVIVPGFVALLLSRALTGMAAGAILPLSILTQLRVFGPAWRPLAIAIYASSTTMGPQLAASIDAWSVERYGWTAILWASLAPGLVSLVTGFFGLWREPIRWRSLIHADLAGVVSLAAGLGLFACGVSQGDRLRWFQSPAIPILMIAGGTCFALFLAHERRHVRYPVVTVGLARRWNLALVALSRLPLQLATIFSGTIVPSALIQLQGFRPEQIAPALTAALWPQLVSYSACVIALRFRAVDTRALGRRLVRGCNRVFLRPADHKRLDRRQPQCWPGAPRDWTSAHHRAFAAHLRWRGDATGGHPRCEHLQRVPEPFGNGCDSMGDNIAEAARPSQICRASIQYRLLSGWTQDDHCHNPRSYRPRRHRPGAPTFAGSSDRRGCSPPPGIRSRGI